jgi:hypothetical protein
MDEEKSKEEIRREKKKASNKKWRIENRENRLKYLNEYYSTHKEEYSIRKKKYNIDHNEDVKKYSCEYYREHSEKIKAYQKNYRTNNVESIRLKKKIYSKLWRSKNKEQGRDNSLRRRAKKLNLPVEKFESLEIFMRDGWICQLCKKRVNKKLKWPHPMSASLDHIIPVNNGGPHTKVNCQLAHLRCNISAGIGGVKQLRMFG